jgi:hypothetical protein
VSQTILSEKPQRSRLRLPALLFSAGLVAAALTIGAPLAANAVPAPTITLSGETLTAYGSFQVEGTGFTPDSDLTFSLDGTDVTSQLPAPKTDDTGSFGDSIGSLHFPAEGGGTVGTHTLVVTDAADLSASATLEVIAAPVPNPATATRTIAQMTSTGVTVTFSGFLPGDSVSAGISNDVNGGPCGDPVTANESGQATLTCVWNAAYVDVFGSTPGAGAYELGAWNGTYTISSDTLKLTVVDPNTPAVPAVAIKGNASFTG